MEHVERPLAVTEIAPLGYGNSESLISYAKQLASGELTAEIAGRAAEVIESGACMKPVDNHDDGCIDGRPTKSLLYVTQEGRYHETLADNNNHERAKVAGGGYVTSVAMRLGSSGHGESFEYDFVDVASTLATHQIYCGAHQGAHAHGEATDCGANDKVKPILQNALRFKDLMAETTAALLAPADIRFDPSLYEAVLRNWRATLDAPGYFDNSTGSSRLETIERVIAHAQATTDAAKPLAVIKNLSGDHKEDFIIINYRDGETFSQTRFATTLAEAFPEVSQKKRAQAFVVDVARLVELSQALADNDDSFSKNLYAGVMYQLATAATLTDGSLRTYIVS